MGEVVPSAILTRHEYSLKASRELIESSRGVGTETQSLKEIANTINKREGEVVDRLSEIVQGIGEQRAALSESFRKSTSDILEKQSAELTDVYKDLAVTLAKVGEGRLGEQDVGKMVDSLQKFVEVSGEIGKQSEASVEVVESLRDISSETNDLLGQFQVEETSKVKESKQIGKHLTEIEKNTNTTVGVLKGGLVEEKKLRDVEQKELREGLEDLGDEVKKGSGSLLGGLKDFPSKIGAIIATAIGAFEFGRWLEKQYGVGTNVVKFFQEDIPAAAGKVRDALTAEFLPGAKERQEKKRFEEALWEGLEEKAEKAPAEVRSMILAMKKRGAEPQTVEEAVRVLEQVPEAFRKETAQEFQRKIREELKSRAWEAEEAIGDVVLEVAKAKGFEPGIAGRLLATPEMTEILMQERVMKERRERGIPEEAFDLGARLRESYESQMRLLEELKKRSGVRSIPPSLDSVQSSPDDPGLQLTAAGKV